MTGIPARLHPDDVEAIAEQVAARLAAMMRQDQPSVHGGLVTAQQVADRFGVTRPWVYEHAAELGGLRLGDGSKPRWRFDANRVAEALTDCSVSSSPPAPEPQRRRAGRPRAAQVTPDGCPLLPIRDESS